MNAPRPIDRALELARGPAVGHIGAIYSATPTCGRLPIATKRRAWAELLNRGGGFSEARQHRTISEPDRLVALPMPWDEESP